MAYQSTVNRKTKQQKIQASARQKTQPQPEAITLATASSTATPSAAIDSYAYVGQDLKKIAWITAVCFIILIISTILISDILFFVHLRTALHLPTL